MSYTKHVKAFGLCLVAALGLMAFSAAGAQAQNGWLAPGGTFITGNTAVTGSLHTDVLLHGEALGAKVLILCKKLVVDAGLLLNTTAPPEGTATLLFSECETSIDGGVTISTDCKPTEPITAKVRAKAILHNSLTYLLFEPEEAGKPFTTILFGNALCLLKPSRPVAGSVVVECLTEDLKTMTEDPSKRDLCLTDLVNHLIQEAPTQSLFGTDGLTFAGKPASLLGIANVVLGAPNAGKTWAVHI